jgi:hypothetical protein
MGYPISEIEGIDKKYKAKLGGAGISTTDELLEKCRTPGDRDKLAEETGIGSGLLLKWAERADLMRIKGVGEESSDLLAATGTGSVKALASSDAKELRIALVETNKEKGLIKRVPSVKVINKWIGNAKEIVEAPGGDPDGVLTEEVPVDDVIPDEGPPEETVEEESVNTDECAETWFQELSPFVRNRFFQGKLMTARDMEAEQEYVRRHFALGRRTIAGWGIVCGLEVSDVSLENGVMTFEVSPGLAVDPFGRFIVVGAPKEPADGPNLPPECEPEQGLERSVNISSILSEHDVNNGALTLYLYIYYDEEEFELVPTFKRDEPCEEELTTNRIRETYGFVISSDKLEVTGDQPGKTCPVPEYKCVLLAKLKGSYENGEWNFGVTDADQAIYSNVELYKMIKGGTGTPTDDGIKTINEIPPDDGGDFTVSEGTGIDIAGDGELIIGLKDADGYIKEIGIGATDKSVEADKNKVDFYGKNGILIFAERHANEVTFSLDHNIIGGEIEIQPDDDGTYPEGKIPLDGLNIDNVVAVNLAYSCPGNRNVERVYFGDPELINKKKDIDVRLAGCIEKVSGGFELRVYLNSASDVGNVKVRYAVIERVKL